MLVATTVQPFCSYLRRIRGTFGIAALGLLTFAAGQLLFGQATGSISGTVTDTSGSAVPGAKVTITAPAIGLTRSSTTNGAGEYIVPLLGVATYDVKVEQPGFQAATAQDIRLQVDEHRELDFKLSPATVQTSVEVSATAVAIQTSDATLGQVITSQQVTDLPLNGRDFVQLATLTPGTSQETNPNSFFNGGPSSEASARGSFSLSVGGSRANSTDWLLDGNDNNELTAGAISILSSIDSIQEFKVLTYNYSAEWGTRGGPTVLVTTKSGSDQFHGSLFEFFRNTDLDARSFFATSTEKFNLNQFGASFGGPIKKDKVFFFADYEQKYQRHGIPFTGVMPTAAMRNGDFSQDPFGQPNTVQLTNPNAPAGTPFMCGPGGTPLPAAANGTQATGTPCNIIPQSLINPIGKALINLYPLPNANNAALGYNYVSEPVRKLDEGKFDIRVDENLTDNDRLFARFSYDQAQSYVPGGAPGFAEQGAFASNQSIGNHARNAAISETHIFSPSTINQITGGFNRIFDYIFSQGNNSLLRADPRHPRRQSGRRELRPDIGGVAESILVAGRSRLRAVRGRDQRLDALRYARYGARQTRYPNRRHDSRQSVEHRGGRFPQRVLGYWECHRRSGGGSPHGADCHRTPRPGVWRRKYRPALEAVSPVHPGRLARQQEFDFESRLGLGHGDAGKRGGQSSVGLQSGHRTVPRLRARMRVRAPASRWIGPRWSLVLAPLGSRLAAATPWSEAAMPSFTIHPGIWVRRGCGKIRRTMRSHLKRAPTCRLDLSRLMRRQTRPISKAPSWRKIRISSKAEFSSSTSMSNRSCPGRLC